MKTVTATPAATAVGTRKTPVVSGLPTNGQPTAQATASQPEKQPEPAEPTPAPAATASQPEPQPAPAPVAEAPKVPSMSELERVLEQFKEMEKLTRAHDKLKATADELNQFDFSPTSEVSNPIQLMIKDTSGHQFSTQNANLIEPLMHFLKQVISDKRVEVEEKLLKYKANA